MKRDPGVLGIRCWSQYGMLYMRHFNELDHELQARLNRAYRPAVKYMESFSSPMGAVIARYLHTNGFFEVTQKKTFLLKKIQISDGTKLFRFAQQIFLIF